jgi:hypothetical protein
MNQKFLKFALLFLAVSCICGMCSKGDKQSDNNNNNGNTSNGLPDENTAYIAYYAIGDRLDINEPHYLVATNYSPLVISTQGDTTQVDFNFANATLKNDASHTNVWDLCNSTYNINGRDIFYGWSRWTGGTQGNLTAGTTYNLSYFKDGVGALTFTSSIGIAFYEHRDKNNTVVVRYDSYPGGNGANIRDCFLKIEKIENNAASGTFSIGLRNGCIDSGGFPYGNNITGRFNKIPIH